MSVSRSKKSNKPMKDQSKAGKHPNLRLKMAKKPAVLKPSLKKKIPKNIKLGNVEPVAAGSSSSMPSFNLNDFVAAKIKPLNMKNRRKFLSDKERSKFNDLLKFNLTLAHSVYKISDEAILEACLFSFQPDDDVKKFGLEKKSEGILNELKPFKDLLLLGDLPTITQEKRPFEWISLAPLLSKEAQIVLMTSLLTISMKLTGSKPKKMRSKIPGGKLVGQKKQDVVAYLSLIHTIIDSMNNANKWDKKAKMSDLKEMKDDLLKIIVKS